MLIGPQMPSRPPLHPASCLPCTFDTRSHTRRCCPLLPKASASSPPTQPWMAPQNTGAWCAARRARDDAIGKSDGHMKSRKTTSFLNVKGRSLLLRYFYQTYITTWQFQNGSLFQKCASHEAMVFRAAAAGRDFLFLLPQLNRVFR